jgi:hypothetical protein
MGHGSLSVVIKEPFIRYPPSCILAGRAAGTGNAF